MKDLFRSFRKKKHDQKPSSSCNHEISGSTDDLTASKSSTGSITGSGSGSGSMCSTSVAASSNKGNVPLNVYVSNTKKSVLCNRSQEAMRKVRSLNALLDMHHHFQIHSPHISCASKFSSTYDDCCDPIYNLNMNVNSSHHSSFRNHHLEGQDNEMNAVPSSVPFTVSFMSSNGDDNGDGLMIEDDVMLATSTVTNHHTHNATSSSTTLVGGAVFNSMSSSSMTNTTASYYTGKVVVLLLLLVVFSTNSQHNHHHHHGGGSNGSVRSSPAANNASTKYAENASLGAAAIGSLTDFFGPILPFAGGRDLLRDYGEWRETVDADNDASSSASLLVMIDGMQWLIGTTISTLFPSSSLLPNIMDIRGGASTATISSSSLIQNTVADAKARRTAFLSSSSSNVSILGASVPFLSTHKIAALTLDEISQIFYYAINCNRISFDVKRFRSRLSINFNDALDAMDNAVSKTRGHDVGPVTQSSENENSDFGNLDALQFCAAMRIFAEWRILRQVPDNYKAYAVGMSLGHKDIVQNIAKVEVAYHAWIGERRYRIEQQNAKRNNEYHELLVGPTLRDLLEIEIELDIHDNKLPRLKDRSAAMGLLWVRRQLMYQTCIFANVNSGNYPDAVTAVSAAYSEVYNNYHGWGVQKIFNYSFKAAPPAEEIYKVMNPMSFQTAIAEAKAVTILQPKPEEDIEESHVEENIANQTNLNLQQLSKEHDKMVLIVTEAENFIENGNVSPSELDSIKFSKNEENPFQRLGNHIATECDKIFSHWLSEWDKLASNVIQAFDKKSIKQSSPVGTKNYGQDRNERSLTKEEIEERVTLEMTRIAHDQIETYLEVIKPLIDDLNGLFKDMNMDDPTKV